MILFPCPRAKLTAVIDEKLISENDISNGMDEETDDEIDFDDPTWL
jgi:hypothetical protein